MARRWPGPAPRQPRTAGLRSAEYADIGRDAARSCAVQVDVLRAARTRPGAARHATADLPRPGPRADAMGSIARTAETRGMVDCGAPDRGCRAGALLVNVARSSWSPTAWSPNARRAMPRHSTPPAREPLPEGHPHGRRRTCSPAAATRSRWASTSSKRALGDAGAELHRQDADEHQPDRRDAAPMSPPAADDLVAAGHPAIDGSLEAGRGCEPWRRTRC